MAIDWITPNSHTDPGDQWQLETLAYDDNTSTDADRDAIGTGIWTSYLHLLPSSPVGQSTKVRFWYNNAGEIKISVYDGSTWEEIHNAASSTGEWVESTVFSSRTVHEAKVAIRHLWGGTHDVHLAEFDFYGEYLPASTSTSTTSTTTTTTTSTSSSTSTTSTSTTLGPTDFLAFGEQNPVGELPVSWQTYSDGVGGIPDVEGDIDWGKIVLEGVEEGRSRVYNFGNADTRSYTLTENKYGAGSGSGSIQIRGSAVSFDQDDALPAWENYAGAIERDWWYVQARLLGPAG